MSSLGTIPARVIQTGKTRQLTLLEEAALTNVSALNPNFEHVFFTDQDVTTFIDSTFPQYRQIFDNFRYPIQRFDFFRYLAVYKLGGFYFDLDVFFARGLAELTSSACVFPFEELTLNRFLRNQRGMDWEIGNYAFGATPSHPFLEAIIENCIRAQQDPAWVAPMLDCIPSLFRSEFEVLYSTGPGLISRTLAERPELARHLTILFPEDVCDSRSWHQFGNYGVHLMAASWRNRSKFLRRRLGQLWENHTRRKLHHASQQLGKRRTLPVPASP